MVSIHLKRPRSSLPMNLVKLGLIFVSFVVVGSFLAAVVNLGFGTHGVLASLSGSLALVPGIVLFVASEDADFDWEAYCETSRYRVDAVVLFVATELAVGVGYYVVNVAGIANPVRLTALFAFFIAYELFVYRNRALFPPYVWPWLGGLYFRVRLDR